MAVSSFSFGLSVMEVSLLSGLLLMEHCNAGHGRVVYILLVEFFEDIGVEVMEGDCYKN